jgi:riboflavin synthase
MFSGIVEGLGEVKKVEKLGNGIRVSVDFKGLPDVDIGDSVSVNGVCLTVVGKGETVSFDIMPETLDKTNLGQLKVGDRVNIEGSLKAGDRIGGHFVTGHIDGTGKVVKVEEDGEFRKLWISADRCVTDMLIPKGSVALDGVSMTVVDIEANRFSVCCIPHTLEITTLGLRKIGEPVNIEIDMIGKWVKRILSGFFSEVK